MSANREDTGVPDVSDAYHRWEELFRAGLRLALSDSDEPAARRWERLLRGHARRLRERDAGWARIVVALRSLSGGR